MTTQGRYAQDLVKPRTRRAFRELAPAIVLRDIDEMWNDEGFQPGSPNSLLGDRRNRFQQYLDAVDWTDAGQVRRALRVFYETSGTVPWKFAAPCLSALERDGYRFDAKGDPIGGPAVGVRGELLSDLGDAEVIREHLHRIERALVDEDPPQAIGSAKELAESTAKLIIRTRGEDPGVTEDLPKLVHRAQILLGVHTSSVGSGVDSLTSTKRILGGLSTVVQGLGELRNAGYGTGHGPGEARVGLYPRHAHLAVSSSRAWCEFMLDTLQDPAAPWRKQDGS